MEHLAPILELAHRQRSQSRVIAALNLAGGIAAVTWAMLARGTSGDAGFLGIFFVGYGIVKLLQNLGPPERDKVYRLLADAPGRVVWAYMKEVRKMNTNSVEERCVIVGADSGKTATLATPSPEDAQRVLQIVRAVAPRASFGFDAEREKQYRANPASLRAA